jgi:hypothetical protein
MALDGFCRVLLGDPGGPLVLQEVGIGCKRAMLAVSGILFIIDSGPDGGRGKIDGPGTRGNGPGGSEDQGKPQNIAKSDQ